MFWTKETRHQKELQKKDRRIKELESELFRKDNFILLISTMFEDHNLRAKPLSIVAEEDDGYSGEVYSICWRNSHCAAAIQLNQKRDKYLLSIFDMNLNSPSDKLYEKEIISDIENLVDSRDLEEFIRRINKKFK